MPYGFKTHRSTNTHNTGTMTSKKHGDVRNGSKNSSVTSRCVAIIFEKCDSVDGNDGDGNSNGPEQRPAFTVGPDTAQQTQKDGDRFNARCVFEEFRQRNKTCYWNPALVDSVVSLEYVGFIEPTTILVRGDDIHLENVRTAWGRRVLKDPARYRITKIGDVNGIEMQEIPQTQFIPLPETLCLILLDLNAAHVVATLDTICERLRLSFRGLHLPTNQHVYDTLGQLIRERKVFHTGFGYFVVTPDTFRLHGDEMPTPYMFSPWTHLHPMYIPAAFSQPLKQATRSISCQADVADNVDGPSEPCDKDTKGFQLEDKLKVDLPMPRMQRSLSLSLKPSQERSSRREERELGGTLKRSSSVKGRQEKKKGTPREVEAVEPPKEEKPKEKVSLLSKLFGRGKKKTPAPPPVEPEKPAVEYATFSAQFPPPEWTWYQQQVDKQLRTETWVQQQMVKSGTWHYLNSLPTDSGTGSLHFATNSVPDRISPVNPPPQPNFMTGVTRRPHKKSHKHKHRSALVIANTPNELGNKDQVEKHPFRNSLGQNSIRLSSLPTRLPSPGDVGQSNYVSHPLYNSTPRYRPGHDVFPVEDRAKPAVVEERKDPTQAKSKSHKKGHRSKKKTHADRHSSVYPMSRHVSGLSAGTHWEQDISYEYQGQLPAKHNEMGVSHHSGVNCIGLGEEQRSGNTYQRTGSYRHMVSETARQSDKVTHFEHDKENVRSRKREYQRSRSYRRTVEDCEGQETENGQGKNCVYQTSHLYRHPLREDCVDGSLAMGDRDTGVHIYANVHVANPEAMANPDNRPKVPERTHRKAQECVSDIQLEDIEPVLDRQQLDSVQVAESEPRSENSSDGVTMSSTSSQEPSSVDSAVDGTESSEHSFGTVVHMRPPCSRQADSMTGQLCDLALGDSGFSSPRVTENSTEVRKVDCYLVKEQNVCNPIKQTEPKLNNSLGKLDGCKLDDCSGESYGRITSDTLYENVKINQKEVLNNMRYLHKEINVSSQNLTRQTSAEDGGATEATVEAKQAVVKKFNFSGDFHVVGVV